ncbi:MAG: exopolysaccharide biosynthesis protein [Mesorhizobium sp.]
MDEALEQSLPGKPRRPAPQRLSAVLTRLAEEAEGPITIAEIRTALGDRSFATLLFLFAAINLIPILPPGSTAILGLPLLVISAQMVWGSTTVWLPKRMLDVSLPQESFRNIVARMVPWLEKLERYIRPRYWPFWPKQGERIVGAIALLLGIIVTLPIPLGNWLPAFSTTLLALALTERDGVLLGVGIAVGIASLLVIAAVIGSVGVIAAYAWTHTGAWF